MLTVDQSIQSQARNEIIHASAPPAADPVLNRLRTLVLAWYDRQHDLTPTSRTLLPNDPAFIHHLHKSTMAELFVQQPGFHALWQQP